MAPADQNNCMQEINGYIWECSSVMVISPSYAAAAASSNRSRRVENSQLSTYKRTECLFIHSIKKNHMLNGWWQSAVYDSPLHLQSVLFFFCVFLFPFRFKKWKTSRSWCKAEKSTDKDFLVWFRLLKFPHLSRRGNFNKWPRFYWRAETMSPSDFVALFPGLHTTALV